MEGSAFNICSDARNAQLAGGSSTLGVSPQRQIPAWMNRLRAEIMILTEKVERLSPVVQLTEKTKNEVADLPLCELGEQLRALTRKLENINNILSDVEL